MAAATVVMGVLTVTAIQSRNEAVEARNDAERQKTQAEDLIEFMLGDLRQKLEPVGRLDALDSVGERALKYFGTLRDEELDADTLGRRARALHMIGEIATLQGNFAHARKVLVEARTATEELLGRLSNDPTRLFEHAQSVYWVGNVDWQMGASDIARTAFDRYLAIAQRLVEMEPENVKWQREVGYAYVNLGSLLLDGHHFDDAAKQLELGVKAFQRLQADYPGDSVVRDDLAEALSWYSDSLRAIGFVRQAGEIMDSRRELYVRLLDSDPKNQDARQNLIVCDLARGRLLVDRGETPKAVELLLETADEAARLSKRDPENKQWSEIEGHVLLALAEVQLLTGQVASAHKRVLMAEAIAQDLVKQDSSVKAWRLELLVPTLILRAMIGMQMKDAEGVRSALSDASIVLAENADVKTGGRISLPWLKAGLGMAHGDAAYFDGKHADAQAIWRSALDALNEGSPLAKGFDDRVLLAALTYRIEPSIKNKERFYQNAEARRPLILHEKFR